MKQKSVRSELAGALAVTMFYVPSWKVSAADSIPLTGNRERKEELVRYARLRRTSYPGNPRADA